MEVGSKGHGPKPYRRELGLGLGIFGLVVISSYALSITPVAFFIDWKYWAGFLGFASLGWLWIGVDAIPGKRRRSKSLLQSWLVVGLLLIIGGSLGSVPLLLPVADSVFAAFFLSLGAKAAWTYLIRGGLKYCVRCGEYRWFLRMNGELYCSKHGHKWERQ